MKILGNGKSGCVVYPPVDCISTIDINKNNYIGKIYYQRFTKTNVKIVQDKINRLPDKFDGILYYKENYFCEIDIPENLKNHPLFLSYDKLSNNQLIFR